MIKKLLFFIVLINLSYNANSSLAEIIPLKKPIQTKEETQKKLLIDFLKPKAKPIAKIEPKKIEKKIVVKKERKSGEEGETRNS